MSLLDWLGFAPPPPRVDRLEGLHARRLSCLHAASFARPWSAEDFADFLLDPVVLGDGVFLGRAAQPAGFVLSRVVVDEAEILSVAVDRAMRGRGLARLLLFHHLQALSYAGAARVHLEVEEGNAPAFALYRRVGFVPSGLRPGYYARPDGTRASATTMTRLLAEPART